MTTPEKTANSIFGESQIPAEFLKQVPDFTSDEATALMLDILRDVYTNRMPFNKYLGVKVTELSVEKAVISIPAREELYGNYIQKILHGGVISAILDLSGGIISQVSAISRMSGKTVEEILNRFSRMSTLNIRVDYIRPGAGDSFYCTSRVIRAGNKVAVTQMELLDNRNELIALGTGSYLIG